MQFALWKYLIHFLASGFGIGFMPILPGTFGSLCGVFFYWFMAPLGHIVEEGPGVGVSIMADDIVAGIFTAAVLHLLRWTNRWLGRA